VSSLRRRSFLGLALGGLVATTSLAEPVTVIRETGPFTRRVDLVIVGDGYAAADKAKYAADVADLVERFFAAPPFDAYAKFFNVRRVDVTSEESGADHPEAAPPSFRDTALDATYNCANIARLVCVNLGKVFDVLARSGIVAAKQDMIWVLVNDPIYGGSGGAVAVGSTHTSAVELMLHESGHSFGFLADEYDYSPPPCNTAFEPSEPNVTRETGRAAIKWHDWIDGATPLPTTDTVPGVPGAYEGGNYCVNGIFRPTFDSKMRSLDRPFEPINEEAFVLRIYDYVSPIDSQTPAATKLTIRRGAKKVFSVKTPAPVGHAITLRWFVDGVARPAWNGLAKVTLATQPLAKGKHLLRVVATDPTDKVRRDDRRLLEASVTWELTIR
jgi:hypothetical protein